MSQKPALGKGLASLFPGMSTPIPMGAPIGTGAVAAGFATTVDQIQAEVAGTRDRHLGISMAAIGAK
ncbi:MAG: hypothetical protein AABZ55_10700, partial [Bdellovibrionota bacterium]